MIYSRTASSLAPSATLELSARAKALAAEGRDIVALSAGQPDFPTPAPIAEAGIRAIREGRTGYTPSSGIPELRKAVAASYSHRRGVEWAQANVLVSCGAKHSLANLIAAAVNPGDRVLLPKPYWVSYPEMVKAAGGIPVYPEGAITPDAIREAASSGVVGVLLNYPSNPSGLVPSRDSIGEIAEALAASDMWVISDDIYEDLYFGEGLVPHLLDARPDLADRTAVVSGVSKTFSMTGWRIGYALASTEWIRLAGLIQSHSTSNPCSISQWAALAALEGVAEDIRVMMLESFRTRRDLICSLLEREEGLSACFPEGAFYVFPRLLSDPMSDDTQRFCSELLDQEGVAVIPGSAFGAEGHIRISFAASEENIREGVRRLGSFLRRRRSP
jgi:aspartate aminotransferase